LIGCPKKATDQEASLAFTAGGKTVKLSRSELTAAVPSETVRSYDPYYAKEKSFRALPLRKVLEAGFKNVPLDQQEYLLRAQDGYSVPMRGSEMLEEGGYVAVEDLDVPGWEPVGPQHQNPGPFYVIWKKPEQQDLETHPRPWQLATIEIATFDQVFPHTSPGAIADGDPALKGYAIFKVECIKCHAINREGGHVGPDLNVPQSIVEYRPEPQIRAYIKNPLAFRYGSMPAHPSLSEQDLDGLLAYFRAMKDRKHDPDAKDGGPSPP
jgi:mono/diheme cytochrome c family protein